MGFQYQLRLFEEMKYQEDMKNVEFRRMKLNVVTKERSNISIFLFLFFFFLKLIK